MPKPLETYLRHLRENGETRTRRQLADDLDVTYRAAADAVQRVTDRDLVDAVVVDAVETTVRERVTDRLVALDEAGRRTTRQQLAEDCDAAYTTIQKTLFHIRDEGGRDLVARTVGRENEPTSTAAEPAVTEPEDLLRYVDGELAAIARDRISGRRLELRIAGLRASIADAL